MVTLVDSPSVLATVDCFDFGDLFWLFVRVTLVHSPSLLGPVDCFDIQPLERFTSTYTPPRGGAALLLSI